MKWAFYKSLVAVFKPVQSRMRFDPSVVKPLIDSESLLQMPKRKFFLFVLDYMRRTKGGIASIDLYKIGEYDAAEKLCLQWINICDAIMKRGKDMIPGVTPRFKFLQIACLGNIQLYRANYSAAEAFFDQALTISEELDDYVGIDNVYAGKAVSLLHQGRYTESIEQCEKALEKNAETKDLSMHKGGILTTMGCAYSSVGQREKAVELHIQALEQTRKEGKSVGVALNNLAVEFMDAGDFQNAKEVLSEALESQRSGVHHFDTVNILVNLGKVEFYLGNFEIGMDYYSEALDLCVKHEFHWHRRGLLIDIGEVLIFAKSEVDLALQYLLQAVTESRTASDISHLISGLMSIGYVHDVLLENFQKARAYYEEAAKELERQRLMLRVQHFKISFAGEHQNLYDLLILLCLRMNDFDSAFLWLEKSKAKALLDGMLSRNGITASSSSAAIHNDGLQAVWHDIAEVRKSLESLYSTLDGKSGSRKNRFLGLREAPPEKIEQKIFEVESRYLSLLEKLQSKDESFANQLCSSGISLPKLLGLLPDSTTIIQLYQTSEFLFVFFVSKRFGVQCATFEFGAEDASELVSASIQGIQGSKDLNVLSHEFLRDVRKPLGEFYDQFQGTFERYLELSDHIIIVPHGFWHFFPFHAMYDYRAREYLIDKFSISYLPASWILGLKGDAYSSSNHGAAVFGDPLGNLPHASEEVARVGALFEQSAEVFEGQQATLEKFLQVSKNAQFLHLATHGMFRMDNPMLSYIELAGKDSNPVRLLATDILNLRFGASLVTLSGCETGVSEVLPGDEVIGLTRAFLVAGAKSLLCSLWRVDDKSTADLMERFYSGMLQDGLSKPESLRRAIIELKSRPEYAHPFFWAPFVYLGV